MTSTLHRRGLRAPAPVRAQAISSSISGARVLVTDEHYKHSLGIVRHLGRRGVSVSVVAGSKRSLACRSRYCREVILAEGGGLDALVTAILQAVERTHFDLIIPVSYAMTLALSQVKEQLLSHTRLELPSVCAVTHAADKLAMTKLAQQLGVPAPRTLLGSAGDHLPGDLRFPLVVKPQRESPGRPPIRYVQNQRQLDTLFREATVPGQTIAASSFIIQEYIPGRGCGLFATYQEGACKRIFMHRRVREYPASGGVSSCAESFYDATLELYGRKMLDALQWHGVAMVEFRRDERDGEYKFLEINPKFWGSLDLALAAGADFPGDLCQMAFNRHLSFNNRYTRDLRFHWPLSGQGDLFHLWTRPASFLAVALDSLNPRVKSNVWLGDLRPNLSELTALAARAFLGRKA